MCESMLVRKHVGGCTCSEIAQRVWHTSARMWRPWHARTSFQEPHQSRARSAPVRQAAVAERQRVALNAAGFRLPRLHVAATLQHLLVAVAADGHVPQQLLRGGALQVCCLAAVVYVPLDVAIQRSSRPADTNTKASQRRKAFRRVSCTCKSAWQIDRQRLKKIILGMHHGNLRCSRTPCRVRRTHHLTHLGAAATPVQTLGAGL